MTSLIRKHLSSATRRANGDNEGINLTQSSSKLSIVPSLPLMTACECTQNALHAVYLPSLPAELSCRQAPQPRQRRCVPTDAVIRSKTRPNLQLRG